MVTDSLGTIRIAHLYPRQMSIYGDTGNIRALAQRALWRGYAVDVIPVDIGPCPDMESVDLVVIGGGKIGRSEPSPKTCAPSKGRPCAAPRKAACPSSPSAAGINCSGHSIAAQTDRRSWG